MVPRYPGIDEALDLAEKTPGRVVMADTADNAGGGAPSDNVTLLAAILRRRIKRAALAAIWDPVSVGACTDAGIGTKLRLRLGGKCGVASGDPIDVEVIVRGIKDRHDQAALGNSRVSMGPSVWLEIGRGGRRSQLHPRSGLFTRRVYRAWNRPVRQALGVGEIQLSLPTTFRRDRRSNYPSSDSRRAPDEFCAAAIQQNTFAGLFSARRGPAQVGCCFD